MDRPDTTSLGGGSALKRAPSCTLEQNCQPSVLGLHCRRTAMLFVSSGMILLLGTGRIGSNPQECGKYQQRGSRWRCCPGLGAHGSWDGPGRGRCSASGRQEGASTYGEIPDPSGSGRLWARRPRERKASQATARGQTETQSSALTGAFS